MQQKTTGKAAKTAIRSGRRVKAFSPDPEAPPRCCDHPDCEEPAGYKAPRGRDNLRSYYWFCLEHVRAYNAKWDFYRGMSPGQIEAHLRADTSWQRPSWKLGNMGQAAKPGFSAEDLHDPLNILRQNAKRKQQEQQRRNAHNPHVAPAELRDSLAILNVSWPTTLQTLKTHYRALARQYHPDANPGNAQAEERFKSIGAAYNIVRAYFNRPDSTHSDSSK